MEPATSPEPPEHEPEPGTELLTAEPSSLPQVGVAEPIVSPLSHAQSFLLDSTPFQWYDLLAQDAINDIQRDNDLAEFSARWDFDETSLSRRPSPEPPLTRDGRARARQNAVNGDDFASSTTDPNGYADVLDLEAPIEPIWNSPTPNTLAGDDLVYMRHYIHHIGPMLDIFDPLRSFSQIVPHLALKNTGLLKSMLAVAARHVSLEQPWTTESPPNDREQRSTSEERHAISNEHSRAARQYYYETLRYLSQTLSTQSYADSHEILATAIMISTFEMLESRSPAGNDEWERHLKGGFWILRCQDNDGESVDGLRRAVWWAWLRQDMWAALRAGRPTLTIWYPKRNLEQLDAAQLCTRIVYIAAKVVEYAGVDPNSATMDIQRRIEHGKKLRDALAAWKQILPLSFSPISYGTPSPRGATASDSASHTAVSDIETPGGSALTQAPVFTPIWIHPPSHAGAIQTFHFARIILLLHIPTIGGPEAYRARQQQVEESVDTVCGIALHEPIEMPLAFVNMQALYAGKKQACAIIYERLRLLTRYLAAGLCVQAPSKREALIGILQRTIKVLKFPTGDLVDDLRQRWEGTSYGCV